MSGIETKIDSYKQSSVEWLFCQLIDKEYKNPHDTELISIIEQAKAMHKEEHRKTYYQGVRSNFHDFYGYYIETFGGEQ